LNLYPQSPQKRKKEERSREMGKIEKRLKNA